MDNTKLPKHAFNYDLEEEEIVDALGNDGNTSVPEQIKRPNPWRRRRRKKKKKKMMMMMHLFYVWFLLLNLQFTIYYRYQISHVSERIVVSLYSQLDTQLPHVNLSFTINHFEKDYRLIHDVMQP